MSTVADLPAPARGVVVTVPLELLMRYFALYALEPVRYRYGVLECKLIQETPS